MTEEMIKFRKLLDENGIKWEDASTKEKPLLDGFDFHIDFHIDRTHFTYKGNNWSVIHGFGTYGGYSNFERDKGLLELMSNAVNGGEPVGYLTADQAMRLVLIGD